MATDDTPPVALTLELGSNAVSPREFHSVVRAFTGFLQDIAEEAGEPDDPVTWKVWVSEGSLRILAGIAPATNSGATSRVMGVVNNPPRRIRRRLDTFPRPVPITRLLAGDDRADILHRPQEAGRHPSQIAEYGTVEGKLVTLSERGRLHFTIAEPIWNLPVQCTVPEELVEGMREMWRQRVSARGMVHYDREGYPTSIRAEEVTLFPYDDTPIEEYRGLYAVD